MTSPLLLAGWAAWTIAALFWTWAAIISMVDQNLSAQRSGIRTGWILVAVVALLLAATFSEGFHP